MSSSGRIFSALICLSLVQWFSPSIASARDGLSWRVSKFDYGLIGSTASDARVTELLKLYLEPALKIETGAPGFHLKSKFSARAWGQRETSLGRKSRSSGAEIRESYVEYGTELTRSRLGFQSLSWGETYGFFIADLANPRDLTDPLLLEIEYIKKPVFMLQSQWFMTRSGSLQAFFTPIARHTEFPVELQRREFSRVGRDSEYGVRLRQLMSFGLDGSLFALRHQDRAVSLNPEQIWSSGLTASQSFGREWVMRTDQVLVDLRKDASDSWRGVLGLDWNVAAGLTLTAQAQRDPRNTGGSLRLMLQGTSGLWRDFTFESFWFHGLEKSENWIQPKLTYTTKNNVSISLRYDWLDGSVLDPGVLAGLIREDRALLWVSYGSYGL